MSHFLCLVLMLVMHGHSKPSHLMVSAELVFPAYPSPLQRLGIGLPSTKPGCLMSLQMVMTYLTCGWMHRCIGYNLDCLPPPLTPRQQTNRGSETSAEMGIKRTAAHHSVCQHRVYTSTPNHTAVNQCGVAECKQTPLVSS